MAVILPTGVESITKQTPKSISFNPSCFTINNPIIGMIRSLIPVKIISFLSFSNSFIFICDIASPITIILNGAVRLPSVFATSSIACGTRSLVRYRITEIIHAITPILKISFHGIAFFSCFAPSCFLHKAPTP